MKKLLLAGAAWLGLTIAAHAQTASAVVVAVCGTPPVTYVPGQTYPLTMDTTGKLCNLTGSGSSSATIVGPLGPSTAPSGAVSITDTGTAINGQTIPTGGQGITGWLSAIYAAAISPLAAGTNIVGKVGIDQTTPGTTNGVVVNSSSLPTGAATAVNQEVTAAGASAASAQSVQGVTGGVPFVDNVTQFGGANLSTGTGLGGSGVPRVTVSNDSQVRIWDGTNQMAVKPASTAAVATDPSSVVQLNPNSPGIIALGPNSIANSVPTIPSSQYPGNATAVAAPVTATATGTTGATVATIPAVSGKTAYICGFTITSDATALAVGTAVVAGTVSGSLSYLQGISAVTSGAGDLTKNFNPCVPASAPNTAITVTSAAAGTGGNTIVNAQGYYL